MIAAAPEKGQSARLAGAPKKARRDTGTTSLRLRRRSGTTFKAVASDREKSPPLSDRSCGVLLHPTSLPGPYGLGDLGPAAHHFVALLSQAKVRWWQMLPVGPIGYGNSPYQSFSTFAGEPLLLSLERLADDGLLERDELTPLSPPRQFASYARAARLKWPLFRLAFKRFAARGGAERAPYEQFVEENRGWLFDYALFAALKTHHGGTSWIEWEETARRRESAERAAESASLTGPTGELALHLFLQYQFERQWRALRDHCQERGVALLGDLPIYAAHDSADTWGAPQLFDMDDDGRLAAQAGVPPDYFSASGQLWGNPLYRWEVHRDEAYRWWLSRLKSALGRFDALRLDHFIGFYRYWRVPAGALTAYEGSYREGPGPHLFEAVRRALGDAGGHLPLIAEDLGVVVPEVKALRAAFGLPGMRVLQFAFGDDPEADSYKPHNFTRDSVVYTGTHDNDTTVGWFMDAGSAASTRAPEAIARERAAAFAYLGLGDARQIHVAMIRAAFSSVANLAIVPLQDWLGLDASARMNRPGTLGGNWEWRARDDDLSESLGEMLAQMAHTYGRATAR